MRVTEKRFHRFTIGVAAFIGLALIPANVFATALIIPDQGVLQIANLSGTLVGVTTLPTNCINWSGGATCNSTAVNMGVSGTSSIFSAPSTGMIWDVQSGVSLGTGGLFETVTGAGAEVGNTIDFNLNSLVVNTGATIGNCGSNAANNSCTPTGSPFTFAMDSTGTQLTISFTALLSGYTGTLASGSTAYRGLFSTQESGTVTGTGACNGVTANITSVLSCEAANGTVQATWSAAESPSATPEPMSFILLGSGLLGLSVLGRRFRRS